MHGKQRHKAREGEAKRPCRASAPTCFVLTSCSRHTGLMCEPRWQVWPYWEPWSGHFLGVHLAHIHISFPWEGISLWDLTWLSFIKGHNHPHLWPPPCLLLPVNSYGLHHLLQCNFYNACNLLIYHGHCLMTPSPSTKMNKTMRKRVLLPTF